jgi:hypothetical protein
MTKTFTEMRQDRQVHRLMVVRHDDREAVVLTRRGDIRSSKWSIGNVTPELRAFALKNA